jgi:hypothetical protein
LKAELRCRYDLLIVIGRTTALQDTLACSAGESFARIQKGIGDTRMTQARSKKIDPQRSAAHGRSSRLEAWCFSAAAFLQGPFYRFIASCCF